MCRVDIKRKQFGEVLECFYDSAGEFSSVIALTVAELEKHTAILILLL